MWPFREVQQKEGLNHVWMMVEPNPSGCFTKKCGVVNRGSGDILKRLDCQWSSERMVENDVHETAAAFEHLLDLPALCDLLSD